MNNTQEPITNPGLTWALDNIMQKHFKLSPPSKRFVLLEGIEHGNRFFSEYSSGDDPTKSATGETWYRVLGYADSVEEAQTALYGRAFPLNP